MARCGRPTVEITLSVEEERLTPPPFVWHKTAEEILERIADYCTAVNEEASS